MARKRNDAEILFHPNCFNKHTCKLPLSSAAAKLLASGMPIK